jgi:glycosyltransferase involved in cell wall biosynthesis
MAGGASWDSGEFEAMVAELRRRGRPLTTISRASDETIWSLYRLARFSVFCSLNEGFGLPVAESLASGTPVITSGFGSMRELAAGHGGVLADPREPREIARAMRELLIDDREIQRLSEQSRTLPRASWDDYAALVWDAVEPSTR